MISPRLLPSVISLFLLYSSLNVASARMAVSEDLLIRISIHRTIAIEKFPDAGPIHVRFRKTENDVIEDAQVEARNIPLNTEIACLEALYGSLREMRHLNPHNCLIALAKENEYVKPDKSIAAFYRDHPKLKQNALVHLIPLAFSDKLFSETELRSSSNLASLGSDRKIALSKLKAIYTSWAPFLRRTQDYTKDEILDHARKVKAKFKLREGKIPPEADSRSNG